MNVESIAVNSTAVNSTAIVSVTAYPDRARVRRRGAVKLGAGTHELIISDLPPLLDPQSVRVGGEGTARVRLLGVDLRETYYTETPSTSTASLEHQIQDKQDADQALKDEDESLQSQLKLLQGMAESAGENLTRGIGLGKAQVVEGNVLLSFIGTHHGQLSGRRREISIARRELAKEVEVLKRELNRLQGARPRQRYQAAVGIEALTGGDFMLDLEYTTRGGAGWQPLYDLRLFAEEGNAFVELTYLAQVQQSTGEDWSGIDLTLSTARPAISAQIPELDTWYVNILRPLPPPAPMAATARFAMDRMLVAEESRASGVADEFTAAAEPEIEPAPAEVVQATVDASGAAVTFHIPRQADIPADNTPHKTTVLLLKFSPKLDFVAVPKMSDQVYRRATIKNDSEVTLLPGPVTLFHSGEFVGRAALDKVAPGEEFETTLGLEDRIKVERKLALNEVSKQFIGDRRVRRYAYEIAVQNLLPHVATLVVQDQLPVAASEEIKIKEESAAPAPTKKSDLNELTWELVLEPQQKQTIRFEFSVSAPRSNTVTGLPEE